jgi:hypothetical protein
MPENQPDPVAQYRALPEPVRLDETFTTLDTEPVPDPLMGRDTETEFMLRNAG